MDTTGGHPLRFGIVTDIHYTSDEQAGRTPAGLARCIAFWKEQETAFVVQLGDLISREGPEAEADLVAMRDAFARFPGKAYHVPGNHCLAVPPGRYREIMGLDSLYYTVTSHGIRFIVIDGMDVSSVNAPQTEADRHLLAYYQDVVKAPCYCGAVGSRQLEWLAKELDLALQNEEPVIILSHLPLLEETSDRKHGLLWNHEEVTALICRYPNVRACFSGHFHPGGYALRDGIRFIVIPGFTTRDEHPGFSCCTVELSQEQLRINGPDGGVFLDTTSNDKTANDDRCMPDTAQ